MQVTVQGYLTLKELVGKRQISLPAASTLQELLASLRNDLDEYFKQQTDGGLQQLSEHLVVLLNGRHASHLPEGMDTVLQEGDEVAVFPPIAGG